LKASAIFGSSGVSVELETSQFSRTNFTGVTYSFPAAVTDTRNRGHHIYFSTPINYGSLPSLDNNSHLIPNYGEKYCYGETVSTAFVESTVNEMAPSGSPLLIADQKGFI
jgi:hypothetical protein